MLTPCPDVSAYPLDDELVLYEPRSGEAYLLNPTGARVWALCDGSRGTGAIARELAGAFGLRGEQVVADVTDIIVALQQARLLTSAEVEDGESGDPSPRAAASAPVVPGVARW